MKTKNSPRRVLRLACMVLAMLSACLLASCEGRDVSLQNELAELRERVRRAEQERDSAIQEKSRQPEHVAGVEIQPVSSLQTKFEEAAKRFEQDVIATFPGYRPASIRRGKFAYVFDEQDPYRILLELSLRPNSTSALTPEVPPISFEARGTVDGEWRMPGQAALREMQAAASARAASQSHAGRRAAQEPPSPQPPATAQSPKGSGPRVVNWGDEESSAPQQPSRPQDSPAQPASPNANSPRASESYEIRFND
jgi:hypothetical protein